MSRTKWRAPGCTPARSRPWPPYSTVEVNLNGVLNTTHAALPHLTRAAATRRRGVADIVTMSSIAGREVPGPVSNVSSAIEHAAGAFSEALRQELAEHHIRTGLVEPGVVVAELTTSGREYPPDVTRPSLLQPDDIAAAVVFMVTRPRHATPPSTRSSCGRPNRSSDHSR